MEIFGTNEGFYLTANSKATSLPVAKDSTSIAALYLLSEYDIQKFTIVIQFLQMDKCVIVYCR
jgi:hypothetical protein